jgi:hypothetical protein
VHREPREGQGHNQGSWPGDGRDRDLSLDGFANQSKTGVGNGRGSGIGYQGYRLSGFENGDQPGNDPGFVVFLEGDLLFLDLEMFE